ncbi:MAG: hypothetical protein ACR2GW_15055 [Pyrinomonadaceae bacterium]
MKIRHHVLLLSLMLFAGAAAAQPAPGGSDSIWLDIGSPSLGLTRGQTLRYTWANLNDPDPQQREFEPLHIRVRLFAADGSLLAQTAAAAVGVGQFQSFDFNRDQLNLPGEPGTGRLQVRLEVTVSGRLRRGNFILDVTFERRLLETFDDAAEIFDTLTGRTTVSFKPKEIVVVGTKIRQN